MIDVVGIDLSLTASGLCRMEHGEPIVETYSPKSKGPHRMTLIRDRVLEFAMQSQGQEVDVLAVIEGIAYSSNGAMTKEIAGMWHVARVALFEADIPVLEVPPPSLKKFATGAGNASKDKVVSQVTHRAGRTFDDNNQADAFVLWCIGREMLGYSHPMAPLPAGHRAALDKLALPKSAGYF